MVAGEGWGGPTLDGSSKEEGGLRLGWLFKRVEGKPLGPRPLGPRLGLGEGSKGFGCGGVGGRIGGVDQGRSNFLKDALWGGRVKGFGSGGVGGRGKGPRDGGPRASVLGGRGTGPRHGANFATCVVFLSSSLPHPPETQNN